MTSTNPEENCAVDDAYTDLTTALQDELQSLLNLAPERAGRDLLTWLKRDAEDALWPILDKLYRDAHRIGWRDCEEENEDFDDEEDED